MAVFQRTRLAVITGRVTSAAFFGTAVHAQSMLFANTNAGAG